MKRKHRLILCIIILFLFIGNIYLTSILSKDLIVAFNLILGLTFGYNVSKIRN